MRRFYCNEPINGSKLTLAGDELHHLKKVLRAKPGLIVEVCDGRGSVHRCEIEEMQKGRIQLNVLESRFEHENRERLIIGLSLLKRVNMNLAVEKLSEIGVDDIVPILFKRTELKYAESMKEKWERTAMQALKVSKGSWLTRIHDGVSLDEFIDSHNEVAERYYCDIAAVNRVPAEKSPFKSTAVVIGPPGDFVDSEKEILLNKGFFPVKINRTVLRVETAAISAASFFRERMIGG